MREPSHSHALHTGPDCLTCRLYLAGDGRLSATRWLAYLEHRYGYGCPACEASSGSLSRLEEPVLELAR